MEFRRLHAFMDTLCEKKGIPGAGCVVYHRGEKVFSRCVGWADVEAGKPVAEDTLFNLYSCSKVSTVTAAMQLIERGAMGLEDPVAGYLPAFAHMEVAHALADGTTTVCPAKVPITVRHLLTMAAGLTYDRESPALTRLLECEPRPTTRQVVDALAEKPLIFEPGTHFRYSMCHDVLGAVIEAVSGMSFGAYLRENIFAPLGMDDTGFTVPAEKMDRMAPEYYDYDYAAGRAKERLTPVGSAYAGVGDRYESGGGGLVSTLHDYGLLAAALANRGTGINGAKILSPETVDMIRTDQMRGLQKDDIAAFHGWYRAGYSYGLGLRTMVDPEKSFSLSHPGEFGWDGKMGCYLLADPAAETAIFYVQCEWGKPWWEWHGMVRNLAYAALDS